jgi:hypothetical protein
MKECDILANISYHPCGHWTLSALASRFSFAMSARAEAYLLKAEEFEAKAEEAEQQSRKRALREMAKTYRRLAAELMQSRMHLVVD